MFTVIVIIRQTSHDSGYTYRTWSSQVNKCELLMYLVSDLRELFSHISGTSDGAARRDAWWLSRIMSGL